MELDLTFVRRTYMIKICDSIVFKQIRQKNIQSNIHLNASKLHLNKRYLILKDT